MKLFGYQYCIHHDGLIHITIYMNLKSTNGFREIVIKMSCGTFVGALCVLPREVNVLLA